MSAFTLGYLRRAVEATMVDTAQIQAATETPDGAGGASVSWTTTATVKCSVDQAGKSAQEQMVAGRLTTTTALHGDAALRDSTHHEQQDPRVWPCLQGGGRPGGRSGGNVREGRL